jgi:hypothetical protein
MVVTKGTARASALRHSHIIRRTAFIIAATEGGGSLLGNLAADSPGGHPPQLPVAAALASPARTIINYPDLPPLVLTRATAPLSAREKLRRPLITNSSIAFVRQLKTKQFVRANLVWTLKRQALDVTVC